MSEMSEDLRTKLASGGLKLTRQRLALAELLFARGDRHLTAEMLYEEARQMRHPPSLATVYNTLHNFAEHGLLREIAIYSRKIWFDTKIGPHFHFYLEAQDELFDIPEELVPMLDINAPEGTMVVGIDVVVRLKQAPVAAASCGVTDQFDLSDLRERRRNSRYARLRQDLPHDPKPCVNQVRRM
jgi:Fur family iron response transcriptional regulator